MLNLVVQTHNVDCCGPVGPRLGPFGNAALVVLEYLDQFRIIYHDNKDCSYAIENLLQIRINHPD